MQQAALLDGAGFDFLSSFEDDFGSAELDLGEGEVSEALVVALVVVVLDEAGDGLLQRAGQVVVLKQNPVLQRLVPAFVLRAYVAR